MPKIPLLRDNKKKRSCTENREFRLTVYLDKRWKQLRSLYFLDLPLCEMCLLNGIIKAGEDIHHRVSFMKFKNDPLKLDEMAFSYDNLITLCRKCHNAIHNGKLQLNERRDA